MVTLARCGIKGAGPGSGGWRSELAGPPRAGEGVVAVPPAWGRAVSIGVRSVHARSFPRQQPTGAAAAEACYVHVSRIALLLCVAAWLPVGSGPLGAMASPIAMTEPYAHSNPGVVALCRRLERNSH